jgi:hypothetical protein
LMHYYATGITPAMAYSKPGTGSAYAHAGRDAMGVISTAERPTKLRLPRRYLWDSSEMVERALAPVRSAGAVVRQDVEAGRLRERGLKPRSFRLKHE